MKRKKRRRKKRKRNRKRKKIERERRQHEEEEEGEENDESKMMKTEGKVHEIKQQITVDMKELTMSTGESFSFLTMYSPSTRSLPHTSTWNVPYTSD